MGPSSSNHKEKTKTNEAQKRKKELVGQNNEVNVSQSKRSVDQTGFSSSPPPPKRTETMFSVTSVDQTSSQPSSPPPPCPILGINVDLSSLSFGSVGFDFEKYRSSVILKKNEIWAVRDEYGMPRRYVLVEKDGNILSASVRFLKHNLTIDSIGQNACGALNTCGTFIAEDALEPLEPSILSHKVVGWEKNKYSKYTIYPRKGEIWAIRKDDTTSLFGHPSPSLCKYEIVEILEDYNFGKGTPVITLVQIDEGSHNLFEQPPPEDANSFPYSKKTMFKEKNKLSHQVPFVRVSRGATGEECYELDPSSLPLFIEDYQSALDPEINDNYLCLGILDQKACRHCVSGLIWAAYDYEYGVPMKYVVVAAPNSNIKQAMHELVLSPTSEHERKWYQAGLPINCGRFMMTSAATKNKYILSHTMVGYPWKDATKPDEDYFVIYPVQGDVWALYAENTLRASNHKSRNYQFVEILGVYEKSVFVALLVRVKGFKSLFLKKDGFVFHIPSECSLFFSHKIPSYRIDTKFSKELAGAIILDPLLVPKKDGEVFSFSDPPLLARSKVYPLWLGMHYIVNKQKKGISLYNEDNIENCSTSPTNKSQEGTATYPNIDEVSLTPVTVKQEPAEGYVNINFHDFDDSRPETSLEVGQIWALYCEFDGVPRSYARVDKILDSGWFVEVTLLEPHPKTAVEMKWVEGNLHMACGTFRVSQSYCIKGITFFSHRVICDEEKTGKLFYTVYPRKGEVWAIYEQWKNFDDCRRNAKNGKYKLVEVVSDFTEEAGVSVAALVRVDGQENVFRRQLHGEFELVRRCKGEELLRFSHRFPASKERGDSIKIRFSHDGICSE